MTTRQEELQAELAAKLGAAAAARAEQEKQQGDEKPAQAEDEWLSAARDANEREQLTEAYELGRDSIKGKKKAAVAELQKLYDAVGGDKDARLRLRNAFDAGMRTEYAKRPRLPSIALKVGNKPAEARTIKALLIEQSAKPTCPYSDKLFKCGSEIVHLSRNELAPEDIRSDENGVQHDLDYHIANDLLVKAADPVWFAERVERTVGFTKEDKEGNERRTEPPEKLLKFVRSIITKQDFAPLAGTVETPTLRKDWSLLDKPGYDPQSKLFYDPGQAKFPAIPVKPTKVDAYHALELFTGERGILHDFEFSDGKAEPKGLSRSIAMAMLLTSVCRRALPTAPAFVINAHRPQSGKTTLGHMTGAIATGRIIAARPWPTNEYQREQTLAMAFESGDPVLLYDNLATTNPFGGSSAELAVTSSLFECRRLGSNSGKDRLVAPTNALLIATGNHVTIGTDMVEGRTLMCNIYPEKPFQSRAGSFLYRFPLDHVRTNRPQLVAALLTILRGFAVAPDKPEPTKFRYREWGDLVACAVRWLGMPDPILAEQRSRVTDPLLEIQEEFTRAWCIQFSGEWVKTEQIIHDPKMATIVTGWLDMQPDRLTWKTLTPFLRDLVGKPVLGFKLEHIPSDGNHRPARWRLETERPGDTERYHNFAGMAATAHDFGQDKEEFAEEGVPPERDVWDI